MMNADADTRARTTMEEIGGRVSSNGWTREMSPDATAKRMTGMSSMRSRIRTRRTIADVKVGDVPDSRFIDDAHWAAAVELYEIMVLGVE